MGYAPRRIATDLIGIDGDTLLNSWTLYQALENLINRPFQLGYSPMFFPDSGSFWTTIAPYGIAIPMLPVYIASGNNLILTYNTYIVLTFPLTTISTYMLTSSIIKADKSIHAIISLSLTFAQFRFLHLGHFETISTHYLIFSLYFLHRTIINPRPAIYFSLGAFSFLTFTTSGYLGIYLVTSSIIITAGSIYTNRGDRLFLLNTTKRIFISIFIFSFLITPIAFSRISNKSFQQQPSFDGIIEWSAPMNGWVSGTSQLYYQLTPFLGEGSVFPGIVPLFLFSYGVYLLYKRRIHESSEQQNIILYVIIALFGFILSLGPVLQLNKAEILPLPFAFLQQFPGYGWIRVPARFVVMSLIGIAVISTYVLKHGSENRPILVQRTFLALLVGITFLELIPFTGVPHRNVFVGSTPGRFMSHLDANTPSNSWLRAQPPGTAVLHLPITSDATFHYVADLQFHQQPMINGTGSYIPAWYALHDWKATPDDATIALLRSRGVSYILLHGNYLPEEQRSVILEQWQRYAIEQKSVQFVVMVGDVTVYRVSPSPSSK